MPSQLFIIIRLRESINGHTQHGGELHERDMPLVNQTKPERLVCVLL